MMINDYVSLYDRLENIDLIIWLKLSLNCYQLVEE